MEHPWVMMLFVDKLDQFGSYRLLYTSACEVVEEDAPGRHQLFISLIRRQHCKGSDQWNIPSGSDVNSLLRSTTVLELQ